MSNWLKLLAMKMWLKAAVTLSYLFAVTVQLL